MATLKASGRAISTFAYQHFRAALLFRDHAGALESTHLDAPFGAFFEDIQSYCSGCIMSGTAALEAFTNQLFISPIDPLRATIPDFENEFWKHPGGVEGKPPLVKYQMALAKLQRDSFIESEQC